MRCTFGKCRNVKDVCPRTKLCPRCDSFLKEYNKSQNEISKEDDDLAQCSSKQQRNHQQQQLSPPPPPAINVADLHSCYEQIKNSQTESPLLINMFALMLNIHTNLAATTETNSKLKREIQTLSEKVSSLESKVGDSTEVSERLGIAIRRLPVPSNGSTDMDLVKWALGELKLDGMYVNTDIISE